MTDRERLIVAIERAKEQSDEAGLDCIVVKFKEANLIIELLKDEPLPVLNVGKCGIYFGDCPHCGKRVTKKNTSYCPYCGRRVKWE